MKNELTIEQLSLFRKRIDKFNRYQFSVLCGIQYAQITKWLNGKCNFSKNRVNYIDKFLKMKEKYSC